MKLLVFVFVFVLKFYLIFAIPRVDDFKIKNLKILPVLNTKRSTKSATPIERLFQNVNVKSLRNVTTVGVLIGAMSVRERMEKTTQMKLQTIKDNVDKRTVSQNKEALRKLERSLVRDQRSLLMLSKLIDAGMNSSKSSLPSPYESQNESGNILLSLDFVKDETDVEEYLQDLEDRINAHLQKLKSMTNVMMTNVVNWYNPPKLKTKQKEKLSASSTTLAPSRHTTSKIISTLSNSRSTTFSTTVSPLQKQNLVNSPSDSHFPQSPFHYQFMTGIALPSYFHGTDTSIPYLFPVQLQNMHPIHLANQRRQDEDDDDDDESKEQNKIESDDNSGDSSDDENTSKDKKKKKESQVQVEVDPVDDDESESSEEDSGPGGLAGLISSLSGGDEGSDVGALVGALSGVITNIFGPDGLDIESLLATGTGLLSGLLAGDENIGKVFANYLGAAIEGLSGGGADLNGQFFGNFLGGTIARLSADPEDDEAPLRPDLFLEYLEKGFKEGISPKAGDGEEPKGGSDSFGFIEKLAKAAIGGILKFVVELVLGSVGGSSESSAGLSSGSSGLSKSSATSSSSSSHPHQPSYNGPNYK